MRWPIRPLIVAVGAVALGLLGWLGGPLVDGWRAADPAPHPAVGPRPAPAQAGLSGRLAVARLEGLWLLPLDGTPPTELVPTPPGDWITGVSWAPNGQRVAYTLVSADADGVLQGADLHVAALSGGDRVLVVHDRPQTLLGAPAWSPDGASILFDVSSLQAGAAPPHLERVAADGSGRATAAPRGTRPSLSADGRRLSYLVQGAGGVGIHVRDLASGGDRVALPAEQGRRVADAVLAPDGASLAFIAPHAGPGDDQSAACSPTAVPLAPVPVPDVAAHGRPAEVWRVGADGSGLARLTSLCLDDPLLAWSPDGNWLAAYGASGLIFIRPDGSHPVRVWQDGSYGGLSWTR